MNWTGLGLVFRRSDWSEVRKRTEMQRTGIYVLVGYRNGDDDLPTLYIGQADGVKGRIDSHHKDKDFWDWAAVFVSTSGGLNRAHVTWIEYALVNRAADTNRCHLDNGNAPQEPALTEAEKADTQGLMKEILQTTRSDAMTDTLIERNPDILGGTPVFAGTRVPVRILMEHLEAGDRLDDFLTDYPTVSRRQAVALLERATTMLVSGGDEAAA